MPKHVHYNVIKAWAEGAEIQLQNTKGEWRTVEPPAWDKNTNYRVKPTPNIVSLKLCIKQEGTHVFLDFARANIAVEFTDGKLTKATVI